MEMRKPWIWSTCTSSSSLIRTLLGDVAKEDADDIIEFTRQYFKHVCVMPARSEAFRKRREAADPAKS
jgi:hypothetical protein